MKYMRSVLVAASVALLFGSLAMYASCTEADAGYDEFASQISNTSATQDSSVPSFVMPEELTSEETGIFTASVEFSNADEHELGRFTVKTANGTLNVYTADGMKAASFKVEGGKMVPSGSQPLDNQVKSTYSGPPGDSYSSFYIYPSSHKAGDGMTPFFSIDHSGGQVSITPGDNLTPNARKSRGKRREGSGSGGCATGGSSSGGG